MLKGEWAIKSVHGILLTLLSCLDQFGRIDFSFVSRNLNAVAHYLAKVGVSCSHEIVWTEDYLSWLSELVLSFVVFGWLINNIFFYQFFFKVRIRVHD